LTILKKGLDVDGALEMLEDISHDIYYGLKIAEDYDTVHELSCLASSSSSAAGEDNGTAENQATRARLAALTLSSTVQNNPKALAEIERHWPKLSAARCPSSPVPLGEATFTLFPPSPSRSPNHHPADAAALTKARVSLLSGLLKSPALRRAFLASDGPSHLVRLLASSPSTSTSTSTSAADDDEAWAPAQRAAAFLLIDNFLDPDMGATLGEWPTRAQLADGDCAARDGKGGSEEEAVEECLDWHVQRIATKYKGVSDHWSHDLRSKLGKYRTAAAAGAAAQDESRKKLDL
jgi:nucleotide exchange factor SIL1